MERSGIFRTFVILVLAVYGAEPSNDEHYCNSSTQKEDPFIMMCQKSSLTVETGMLFLDSTGAPNYQTVECECNITMTHTQTLNIMYRSPGYVNDCGIEISLDDETFGCENQSNPITISSSRNTIKYRKYRADTSEWHACIGLEHIRGNLTVECFPWRPFIVTPKPPTTTPKPTTTTPKPTTTTTKGTTTTPKPTTTTPKPTTTTPKPTTTTPKPTTTTPKLTTTTPKPTTTTTKGTTTTPKPTTTTPKPTTTTPKPTTTTQKPTTTTPKPTTTTPKPATTTPKPTTTTPKPTTTTPKPTTTTPKPTTTTSKTTTTTPKPTTTTPKPTTTAKSTAAPTPEDKTSQTSTDDPNVGAVRTDDSKEGVNWGIVGGVLGALVLIGLVIFIICLLFRRKKKEKKRARLRYSVSSGDVIVTENELYNYDGENPTNAYNAVFVGGIPQTPGQDSNFIPRFRGNTVDRNTEANGVAMRPKPSLPDRPNLQTFRGPSFFGGTDTDQTDVKQTDDVLVVDVPHTDQIGPAVAHNPGFNFGTSTPVRPRPNLPEKPKLRNFNRPDIKEDSSENQSQVNGEIPVDKQGSVQAVSPFAAHNPAYTGDYMMPISSGSTVTDERSDAASVSPYDYIDHSKLERDDAEFNDVFLGGDESNDRQYANFPGQARDDDHYKRFITSTPQANSIPEVGYVNSPTRDESYHY